MKDWDCFKLEEYRKELKEDLRMLHRTKRRTDSKDVKKAIYEKELSLMNTIRDVEKAIYDKRPYKRIRSYSKSEQRYIRGEDYYVRNI